MRRRVGAAPNVSAMRMTTGISTMTNGVLFIRPESTHAPASKAHTAIQPLVLACATSTLATASSRPVRTSAPDRMNMAAMVMGAGFENTASTSSVEI